MKQRAQRVAEELRKTVTEILYRDITDPRLGFLTITHIEVADDLRFGRIYYSVLGSEEDKEFTAEALNEHLSQIRRLCAERIQMKFAMELKFELDRSIDENFKIDSILRKIKKPDDPK